jgi:hypothetical protein
VSDYGDVVQGIVTRLETIPGMKAFDYPADSVNHFPSAVVLPTEVDPELSFDGNDIEMSFIITVLFASGSDFSGFRSIYEYIDPTHANSVIKALRADPTLDSKADTSRVGLVTDIGRRELWGGWYFAFDLSLEATKTIA